MQIARYFLRAGLGLSLAFLCSCSQSPLETTESRNESGQVERWQQRKDNHKKEGLYQRFSPAGVLVEEAHYLADSLDGERKYFFPNGKVESLEHFKNGQFHGKYQAFYETGQLKVEQEFVDGAMNGLSTLYYPSGALKEKVMLVNNVENGPFVEYYENGKIKTEGTYGPNPDGDEGVEQGELKEYDETGQLLRIADCKDGMCLTRWKK